MIIYIKELDKNDRLDELEKYPKFIRKMILGYLRTTNSFITTNIDEVNQKYLLFSSNERTFNKINKKIKKKKQETKRKLQVVISEGLKKYNDIITNANIIDGKNTYINHIEEVLEYVIDDVPLELTDVYVLYRYSCWH